jgi:hypothetical protein
MYRNALPGLIVNISCVLRDGITAERMKIKQYCFELLKQHPVKVPTDASEEAIPRKPVILQRTTQTFQHHATTIILQTLPQ